MGRLIRLIDLAPWESVLVRCGCGRIAGYGSGVLQRLHRVPSDTLVYDLQFRFRCRRCNRTGGFGISIEDQRGLGDNTRRKPERVIVPKRE